MNKVKLEKIFILQGQSVIFFCARSMPINLFSPEILTDTKLTLKQFKPSFALMPLIMSWRKMFKDKGLFINYVIKIGGRGSEYL